MTCIGKRGEAVNVPVLDPAWPAGFFYGGAMLLKISGHKPVSKKNKLKFGKGRAYKTSDVTQWEDLVKALAQKHWVGDPLEGDVHMKILVHVPDRRRRDLQNFPDTICDALQGVCYKDDSQITKLELEKVYVKGQWYVEIYVGDTTLTSVELSMSPCRLT